MSVKENVLNNPALIQRKDYERIMKTGCSWVAEVSGKLGGFGMIDTSKAVLWALFIHPDFEGQGIGSLLHDKLLSHYFESFDNSLWLSTAPGTRAERFYLAKTWQQQKNLTPDGEAQFIMTRASWLMQGKR